MFVVWLRPQRGAGVANHDPVGALTVNSELPFVLSSAVISAAERSSPEGLRPSTARDVIDALEALSHSGAGDGLSEIETVAALWRTLLGVGEARRNLNALEESEAVLVALIEKLTGRHAGGEAPETIWGQALPLMLGTTTEKLPGALQASGEVLLSAPKGMRVRLLGRFDVEIDGRPLPAWRSRRAKQLFQFLLLNRGEEVSRHQLAGLFWPEHNEERAGNNLSLTVMTLRRVLEQAASGAGTRVVLASGSYHLDTVGLWLDVDEFEKAIEQGRALEKAGQAADAADAFDRAVTLYAGDLLPSELYEEWTIARRQRLQDRFLDALQRRAAIARVEGDTGLSIRLNQRALEVDPALDAAHRQLIIDYLETGQRSRAAQQVEACREALKRYLGEEPGPESLAVFARVPGRINP
jgi:DNA-binding SARP family transcriptional activator